MIDENQVVVIGSGGHSRFVISLLKAQGVAIAGIVDIHEIPDGNEKILEVPVIWSIDKLECLYASGITVAYIAIGDNVERKQIYAKASAIGFSLPNIIHVSSQICHSSVMGDANIIGPCVVIGANVEIGSNNIINSGAIIEHEAFIGSHSHISLGAVMCGRTRANDLFMLGANATILPNVKIARSITIGAGAVITKNINDDNGVYIGIPGVKIK